MALTPPPQFSGYQPGSLAGRSTVKKGGVRRQGESTEAFGQRMDARYASNQPAAVTPPPREENIVQSRMDGTFQGKVDAYNKANASAGKQMNEAGQIVSTSSNLSSGNAAGNASVMPGNAPKGVTPPSPGRYTGPMAAPPPPRKPATFDGKSFAQLTQEGANKYGSAAYGSVRFKGPMAANPAPAAPKPSVTNAAAMVAAAIKPPTPATTVPTPGATPAPAASNAVTPPQPAGKPWKPPVLAQMAPPPGLPASAQQFQASMKPPAPAPSTPSTSPPSTPSTSPPPLPTGKSIAELKAGAEAGKYSRQSGVKKIGQAVVTGVKKTGQAVVTGVKKTAQGINTGTPAAVSSVTGGIKSAGDSMVSGINQAVAPLRQWLQGSDQKTAAELEYDAALAKQQPPKPPGVPAVTPKPGSSAPRPFSAAALGNSQPRAVMPPLPPAFR